jgi:RNA polymerase primary sigma factor
MPSAEGDLISLSEQDITQPRYNRGMAPRVTPSDQDEQRGPVLARREQLLSDDLFKMYLREIGKVPLLNAEKEVELAKRIEAGLYAGRLLLELEARGKELPHKASDEAHKGVRVQKEPEESHELRTQPPLLEELKVLEADGIQAKDQMIVANLRLVVSVAKRYTGHGMSMLDLVQEGNAGLIRGVEKFDYAKGYKFSTYGTWWIRQAITRAIADQARTIRIPVHAVEEINKIRRTRGGLIAELDRDPTDVEVAQKLDIGIERIQWLDRIGRTPASLEKSIGDGGGGPGEKETTLGDLLGDEAEDDRAEASAAHTLLGEALEDHLSILNDREANIMRWRYGLDGNGECTLQEIGRRLGITRERARQIETKAMDKLKGYAAHSGLHDFLS